MLCISEFCRQNSDFCLRILTFVVRTKAKAKANAIVKIRTEVQTKWQANDPIQGIKQLESLDFCKVAALIDKGKHLTDEGLAEILLIKDRMNTKRK